MLPDHYIPTMIAIDLHKLREEAGRKHTGVSALTGMAESHNVVGMSAVKIHKLCYAFAPQHRLIRHLKEQCITGLQRTDTKLDGVALPHLGMAVDNWCKAKFL